MFDGYNIPGVCVSGRCDGPAEVELLSNTGSLAIGDSFGLSSFLFFSTLSTPASTQCKNAIYIHRKCRRQIESRKYALIKL